MCSFLLYPFFSFSLLITLKLGIGSNNAAQTLPSFFRLPASTQYRLLVAHLPSCCRALSQGASARRAASALRVVSVYLSCGSFLPPLLPLLISALGQAASPSTGEEVHPTGGTRAVGHS